MDLLQNNKAAHSPVAKECDADPNKSVAWLERIESAQKITDSPTIEISDGQLDQLLLEQQLHIKTNHSAFPSMQEFRQKLPIWSRKDEILETIHNHQVIVLCGETGSGVVTQVGQFLLDQAIESGRGSSIRAICTQTRGRAAALVAQRVAQERCEPCGGNTSSVGYWIGQELSRPPREKGSIIFCTTDMLFHHLQCDTNLDNFSHIFLGNHIISKITSCFNTLLNSSHFFFNFTDQVHERDVQMDLLLIALRDVLPKRPLLKLILISSTTYTNIFPQYLPSCPVLVIHGMIHPVETIHLEEILSQLDYKFEPSKSRRGRFGPLTSEDILDNEYKLLVGPSLLRMEAEENYPEHVLMSLCVRESEDSPVDLILALLKRICSGEHTGSILIFFPGIIFNI